MNQHRPGRGLVWIDDFEGRETAVRLATVYARFFRSLNYDYMRKTARDYAPLPWDGTPSGDDYPFVRVTLERDITTVVGANESGKSQLLGALKRALTGKSIERGDFCRYSPFFQDDELPFPEFGLEFVDLGASDLRVLRDVCGQPMPDGTDRIAIFRMNNTPMLRVYALAGGAWEVFTAQKTSLPDLAVPGFFEIDADVPLPDSVPLDFLAAPEKTKSKDPRRLARVMAYLTDHPKVMGSAAEVTAAAEELVKLYAAPDPEEEATLKKHLLAADLLIKVAGLPRDQFVELRTAARDGREGYATSIVNRVNEQLARAMNFPQWWSQDSNFELYVELRGEELVFLIRDRTGTSYSFDERSAGLKYFLSYVVQYKAHEPRNDGRPELLLMDEPDAYLSSSGQQDLLRIFDAFAHPREDGVAPVQVVYVTHSPFLIDKNHSERIRVLEKGEHDEGTRVVANASRNHYEPLRSAFGAYVGETAFIGTCNLMLEGASDQVLLAGMSARLRRSGSGSRETLDLNDLTLVPAGSASQVPYMVYLARGRDVDQPAVIALLDSDKAGDDARKVLGRGGPRRKQLLAEEFILQLGDEELDDLTCDNPRGRVGVEDLIPLGLAYKAAKAYCREFVTDADLDGLRADHAAVFDGGRDTLTGIEQALKSHLKDDGFHLDKIGFARSVLDVVEHEADGADDIVRLERNFKLVFERLGERQREADRRVRSEKIRSRVNRIRRRFEADHPSSASRDDVLLLVEEMERQLDESVEAEDVRAQMRSWTDAFDLRADDPQVELDHPRFMKELRGLAYAGTHEVQESPGA